MHSVEHLLSLIEKRSSTLASPINRHNNALEMLSESEFFRLLRAMQRNDLLNYMLFKIYGDQLNRRINHFRQQGELDHLMIINDVHDPFLRGKRERTKQWLALVSKDGERFRTFLNRSLDKQQTLTEAEYKIHLDELQKITGEQVAREEAQALAEYISFFMNEYKKEGTTGFLTLARIMAFCTEQHISSEERQNRILLLIGALNDARVAYEGKDHVFFTGTLYSCMPGLEERLLDYIASYNTVFLEPVEKNSPEEIFSFTKPYTTKDSIDFPLSPVLYGVFLHSIFENGLKTKKESKIKRFLFDKDGFQEKLLQWHKLKKVHLDENKKKLESEKEKLEGMKAKSSSNYEVDLDSIKKEDHELLNQLRITNNKLENNNELIEFYNQGQFKPDSKDLSPQKIHLIRYFSVEKFLDRDVEEVQFDHELSEFLKNFEGYVETETKETLDPEELAPSVYGKLFSTDESEKIQFIVSILLNAGFSKKHLIFMSTELARGWDPDCKFLANVLLDMLVAGLYSEELNVPRGSFQEKVDTWIHQTIENSCEIASNLSFKEHLYSSTQLLEHIANVYICEEDTQNLFLCDDDLLSEIVVRYLNLDEHQDLRHYLAIMACTYFYPKTLEALLTTPPGLEDEYFDSENFFADHLLTQIVEFNYEYLLEMLLSQMSTEFITDNYNLLTIAVEFDSYEAALSLLNHGVFIDGKNDNGDSALSCAIENKNYRFVKMLLDHGANIYGTNSEGMTHLQVALEDNHTKTVLILLENGADVMDLERDHFGIFLKEKEQVTHNVSMVLNCAKNEEDKKTILKNFFISAVRNGDLSSLAELMKIQSDLFITDHLGKNLLMHAIEAQQHSMFKFLVESKINPYDQDYLGRNVIVYALKCVDKFFINILILNYEIDFTDVDKNNKSLLMYALESSDRESIKMALSSIDIDVEHVDHQGKNLLMYAAQHADVKVINYLLRIGVNTMHRDCEGNTLMMEAVRYNRFELAKFLLTICPQSNEHNDHGQTPLMFACQYAEIEMIDLFLEQGYCIYQKDSAERTLLMYAVQNRRSNFYQRLFDKGFDVNSVDREGKNALYYAIKAGHRDAIDFLIDKKIDLKSPDVYGKTALFYAIEKSDQRSVRKIMSFACDINSVDCFGMTPLMYAIKHDDNRIISDVLKSNPNLHLKDLNGQQAFTHAVLSQDIEKIQHLFSYELDLDIEDRFGKTVLMHAIELQAIHVVEFLLKNGADLNYASCLTGKNGLTLALEINNRHLIHLLFNYEFIDCLNTRTYYRHLYVCIDKNDVELFALSVKFKHRAGLERISSAGETLLTLAAKKGKYDIVEIILEKAPQLLNKTNSHNQTALALALECGNLKIIELLIRSGIRLNLEGDALDSTLQRILDTDHNGVIETFLATQALANSSDSFLDLMVRYVVARGLETSLASILSCAPHISLNTCDERGDSLLILAFRNNQLSMMKFLFDRGVSLHQKNNQGESIFDLLVNRIKELHDLCLANYEQNPLLNFSYIVDLKKINSLLESVRNLETRDPVADITGASTSVVKDAKQSEEDDTNPEPKPKRARLLTFS